MRDGYWVTLLVKLGVVACLSLLLLWQWVQIRQVATPLEVAARTAPPPAATPVTAVTAMPIAPAQADPPAQPAS